MQYNFILTNYIFQVMSYSEVLGELSFTPGSLLFYILYETTLSTENSVYAIWTYDTMS